MNRNLFALVMLAAFCVTACSVIYVSETKQKHNPACLIGCEVTEAAPAASAPEK